jgi:hypothetical protein
MTYFVYYIVFSLSSDIFLFLTFALASFTLRKYPKSKLSKFFRNNIVSDIDEEPYK